MAEIKVRARYTKKPFTGLIKIHQIAGKKPVTYSLVLYHETKGKFNCKKIFKTIESAIAEAVNFGFISHQWEIETLEY